MIVSLSRFPNNGNARTDLILFVRLFTDWRQTPLFDALSYGCKSIEADIYLVGSGEKADLLVCFGFSSFSLPSTDNFVDVAGRTQSDQSLS